MKAKSRIRTLLFVFIALLFSSVFSLLSIAEWPDYSDEPLTDEQKQHIINVTELSVIEKEPEKEALKRIDVNQKGEIVCTFAVVPFISQWETVCVYSADGVFEYGYRLSAGGYGACWQGDDVLLFKNHVGLLVDRQGHYKDIRTLTYSLDNMHYMGGVPVQTEFEANDQTFTLKSRLAILNLTNTYSQIVKTTANGSERVIYDASKEQETSVFLTVAFIAIIVIGAAGGVTVTFVSLKKVGRKIPQPFGTKPTS